MIIVICKMIQSLEKMRNNYICELRTEQIENYDWNSIMKDRKAQYY